MAGRIPQEFIDSVIARVNIVDVIDARVPLNKKSGRDYQARCPFHEEKTPSFTVSEAKQFYHCFGCGANGTAIGFLMQHDHRTFPEAVEELAALVGLEVPREGGPAARPNPVSNSLIEIVEKANAYFQRMLREHPQAHTAIDYLRGREVNGETAKRFGLGFAPEAWEGLISALDPDGTKQQLLLSAGLVLKRDSGGVYDRFRGRVIFPIEDHRGRVVAFGGRVIGDGEPKYLNSPETALFRKRAELYGLHLARAALNRENRAIVVEGYMDVVALAQFGVDNAVATLGTATTQTHIERLFRFVPEIVFCFDGDNAGRRAAWKALQESLALMQDGRQISFLFLPDGEDPDSIVRKEGEEGFRERVDDAEPLTDFMVRELSSQTDITRLDGRARLVELARPLIETVPDGLFRQLLLNEITSTAGVDASAADQRMTSKPGPSQTPGATHQRRRAAPATREPLSRAIALILQNPRLANCDEDYAELLQLGGPGVETLLMLLQEAKSSPEMTTPVLLERFREHKFHSRLEQLAVAPQILEDATESGEIDFESEYRGYIATLRQQARHRQFDELQRKADAGEATASDLQALVARLHQDKDPASESEDTEKA